MGSNAATSASRSTSTCTTLACPCSTLVRTAGLIAWDFTRCHCWAAKTSATTSLLSHLVRRSWTTATETFSTHRSRRTWCGARSARGGRITKTTTVVPSDGRRELSEREKQKQRSSPGEQVPPGAGIDIVGLRSAYNEDASARLVIDHFVSRQRNHNATTSRRWILSWMLWIEVERHRCATPLFAFSDAWTHSASVDSYRAGKGMSHHLSGGEISLSARTCH